MSLVIIDSYAEDQIYATIIAKEQDKGLPDKKAENLSFLQSRYFQIAMSLEPEAIEDLFKDVVFEQEVTVFCCKDGDLVFKWDGDDEPIKGQLIRAIQATYGEKIKEVMEPQDFFSYYNWLEGLGKLKTECSRKLKKQSKKERELATYFANETLINTLRKTIQLTHMQRAFRTQPHILIVEDQKFSQKILLSVLKDYTCHIAESSGEALLQYMEKCPDIVLLDIELPDISGHKFAGLLKKIDEHANVIMISANQTEYDIQKAKENGVKGFIVKPYEKNLVLDAVEKCKKPSQRKKL